MKCLNCGKNLIGKQTKWCSRLCATIAWDKAHPEDAAARFRRYQQTESGKAVQVRREYNPERIEYKKQRLKTDKGREYSRRKFESRRTRVAGGQTGFTAKDWEAALEYFDNKCAYCGGTGKLHQEHYIPTARGGGYTRDNIVPACSKCNGSKRDRNPIDWLLNLPNALITYARITMYLRNV